MLSLSIICTLLLKNYMKELSPTLFMIEPILSRGNKYSYEILLLNMLTYKQLHMLFLLAHSLLSGDPVTSVYWLTITPS